MKKNDILKAVTKIVTAAAPGVVWHENIVGVSLGRGVHGSVTCNALNFDYEDKTTVTATATMDITVIDVNGANVVDAMADDIMAALWDNPDLSGVAYDSGVQKVVYGTPQGIPKATAASVVFEVLFNYEQGVKNGESTCKTFRRTW